MSVPSYWTFSLFYSRRQQRLVRIFLSVHGMPITPGHTRVPVGTHTFSGSYTIVKSSTRSKRRTSTGAASCIKCDHIVKTHANRLILLSAHFIFAAFRTNTIGHQEVSIRIRVPSLEASRRLITIATCNRIPCRRTTRCRHPLEVTAESEPCFANITKLALFVTYHSLLILLPRTHWLVVFRTVLTLWRIRRGLGFAFSTDKLRETPLRILLLNTSIAKRLSRTHRVIYSWTRDIKIILRE